jgi:hypothetical protein
VPSSPFPRHSQRIGDSEDATVQRTNDQGQKTKKKPSAVAREGFFVFRGLRFWSQGPKRYGVTFLTTSLSSDSLEPRARLEVKTSYFFFVVFFVVFFADFFFLAAMALSPPFSARKCKGGEKQSQCFFHAATDFFASGKAHRGDAESAEKRRKSGEPRVNADARGSETSSPKSQNSNSKFCISDPRTSAPIRG